MASQILDPLPKRGYQAWGQITGWLSCVKASSRRFREGTAQGYCIINSVELRKHVWEWLPSVTEAHQPIWWYQDRKSLDVLGSWGRNAHSEFNAFFKGKEVVWDLSHSTMKDAVRREPSLNQNDSSQPGKPPDGWTRNICCLNPDISNWQRLWVRGRLNSVQF